MIVISPAAPAESIIALVKCWMKLLAEGRVEEACALLDEPNRYGITWTSGLIQETVNSIFSPESRFHETHPEGPIFTNPFELEEQLEIEVVEFDDKRGYTFDYNVPLNGEWSDLTAQFEFLKRSDGYVVVLHDLHVL
jgi:hypothetical protein